MVKQLFRYFYAGMLLGAISLAINPLLLYLYESTLNDGLTTISTNVIYFINIAFYTYTFVGILYLLDKYHK